MCNTKIAEGLQLLIGNSTALIVFIAFSLLSTQLLQAQNYDETKVGAYVLPDPLIDRDGNRVKSKKQWQAEQRPQILKMFKDHVYGEFPEATKGIRFEVTSIDKQAMQGRATRKEITVYFTPEAGSPSMDVLLYLPNNMNKPVPVFIGLNFYGNHSAQPDPGIKLSQQWMRENNAFHIVNNKATEKSRGVQADRWPIDSIIARGYGVATAYYGDLEPDHPEGFVSGIRTTLQEELLIRPEAWSAIGAWGWGLCRMLDYLETDESVDAKQVIITGHSRLGKAALWAAANDERFAMAVSNCSGEGGAALARRNFGETVETINTSFPHWFISAYKKYNKDVNAMPVDQHMLLALMAPRPVFVGSAAEDLWADPKGEYLSLVFATPVYVLFDKKGFNIEDQPQLNVPMMRDVGYCIRSGKHSITPHDWGQFMNFADMHLRK